MVKVLIIDDEPVVRRGLKTVINWGMLNCIICGEAPDGIEGLKRIEELKPDIVMVDIKMPEMNGLELIKYTREKGYKCKFIVLSGYNDFEYAQQAISLGVKAYLLKPIEEAELKELVVKFVQELNEEQKIQEAIDHSTRLKKSKIVKSFINKEDYESLLQRYGTDYLAEYSQFCCFCISIVNIKNIDTESSLELLNELFINESSLEVSDYRGNALILFKDCEMNKIKRILTLLRKRLQEEYNKEVFITVGRIVNSYNMLAVSYEDSRILLNNQFFYEHLGVKYYSDLALECIQEESRPENLNVSAFIDDMYLAVELNDMEKFKRSLEKLTCGFEYNNINAEKAKGICANIITGLLNKLGDKYQELRGTYSHEEVLNSIYDKYSMAELTEYMMSISMDITRRIGSSNSELIIKRVIDYINKNYDKELKVETLAERFNYNNAYLGQLFKSTTGEYFNAYIDRLRIENAKRLLIMGLKTTEVAQKAGFKNLDYFYNKFKKHVGVGPSEFRKINGQEGIK